MSEITEATLRARVEELMKAGVSADMEKLDSIYHDNIVVMDLSIDGHLVTLEKKDFMALLEQTFKDKNPDDHMWARIHSLTVSGDRGHVLISRKIPVGGPNRLIDLSIDFVFEDGRWQVTREVNFSRPDAEAA
ncbi:nuclear transport factor 2 family protein [Pelagibacterium xiamenense]|uniref:nuclear transport factor 2 family protein n=1 Tax=Pelagibacterium xiamenense TaxID=2901140 RepID=UPI001E419907|nr:nuclear transport factor 2 family protein [Pelagibacterium xiamenense]MCD7058595.1 nuclear transport factor 2 family protein [Pelagibacterium xiamenense]